MASPIVDHIPTAAMHLISAQDISGPPRALLPDRTICVSTAVLSYLASDFPWSLSDFVQVENNQCVSGRCLAGYGGGSESKCACGSG